MAKNVRKSLRISLACLALSLPTAIGQSATYDELLDGDLSDAPASPTPWLLESGVNVLSGRAGKNATQGTIDFDLATFTVPAGRQLDSITVTSYLNEDEFAIAFFALQAGTPWDDNVGDLINGHALMGWAHIDSSMTGIDLLAEFQANANAPIFAIPLPAGAYTMLIQDIDTEFDYSLSFNASAVPEPASAAMAALGVILALRRRHAARRR
jgi:hypothetical protein